MSKRNTDHPGTEPVAADPDDLDGATPESPGASTGLERPVSKAGPVADTPVVDPEQFVDDDDRPG